MHIQGTYNDIFANERQCRFGMSIGQIWVIEEDGICTHIHCNARFSGGCGISHNTLFAHTQTMMPFERFCATMLYSLPVMGSVNSDGVLEALLDSENSTALAI